MILLNYNSYRDARNGKYIVANRFPEAKTKKAKK
jgi:hypothetical protein